MAPAPFEGTVRPFDPAAFVLSSDATPRREGEGFTVARPEPAVATGRETGRGEAGDFAGATFFDPRDDEAAADEERPAPREVRVVDSAVALPVEAVAEREPLFLSVAALDVDFFDLLFAAFFFVVGSELDRRRRRDVVVASVASVVVGAE
ncbi:MAG: hypothetical protein LBM23_03985 [Propionibacteriaceae bacterium]|nr:hypothetical protein [Propionibacteriaceae bacterium]